MRLNLNLINGRFITLDDDIHNVQSVTIEKGKIIKQGSPESILNNIQKR